LAGAPPQTPLESSQCSPRSTSWILGVLHLRRGRGGKGGREGKEEDKGGQEKGGEGEEGKRGREGKVGEGKILWICSPRKNFLAMPLTSTRVRLIRPVVMAS